MSEFEGLSHYPIAFGGIPEDWTVVSLFDAGCRVESGFASGKHNSSGHGVAHLRPMNVDRGGHIDLSVVKSVAADKSQKRIRRGDVLFNNTNSPVLVGKTAHVGLEGDWAFSNHMTRIEPSEVLDAQFAAHQLHFLWSTGYFAHICTNHVNQASISSKRLASAVPVVLPPLPEQRRIVAAIEEHFSRLDAAEADLDASVQKSRMLAQSLINSRLDGSPKRLGDLLAEPLRNGLSAKTSVTGSVRVLTLTAVTKDCFEDAYTKLIDDPERSLDDLWLEPGDIFIQRSNTPSLVGSAALYDGPRQWAIFPDLLIRIRLGPAALPGYVAIALKSSGVRSYFQNSAQGIAGSMPKISQPIVEAALIPLPAIEEQEAIIAQFSADAQQAHLMELEVNRAVCRLRSLRRSILAAAFSGRLVPQDPSDEPASALLERIAAERAASIPTRKKKAAS
jgi:type I restriction enzyme S subunit